MRAASILAALAVTVVCATRAFAEGPPVPIPPHLQTPGATFFPYNGAPQYIVVLEARDAVVNRTIALHGMMTVYNLDGTPALVQSQGQNPGAPFRLNLNGFPRTLNEVRPDKLGQFPYGNTMTIVCDESQMIRGVTNYLRLTDGRTYLQDGWIPGLSNTALEEAARGFGMEDGIARANTGTGNGRLLGYYGREWTSYTNDGYFGTRGNIRDWRYYARSGRAIAYNTAVRAPQIGDAANTALFTVPAGMELFGRVGEAVGGEAGYYAGAAWGGAVGADMAVITATGVSPAGAYSPALMTANGISRAGAVVRGVGGRAVGLLASGGGLLALAIVGTAVVGTVAITTVAYPGTWDDIRAGFAAEAHLPPGSRGVWWHFFHPNTSAVVVPGISGRPGSSDYRNALCQQNCISFGWNSNNCQCCRAGREYGCQLRATATAQ